MQRDGAPVVLRRLGAAAPRHGLAVPRVRGDRGRGGGAAVLLPVPVQGRRAEAHHVQGAVVPRRVPPVDPRAGGAGLGQAGARGRHTEHTEAALRAPVHPVQAADGRQDPVRPPRVLPGVPSAVRQGRGLPDGDRGQRRRQRAAAHVLPPPRPAEPGDGAALRQPPRPRGEGQGEGNGCGGRGGGPRGGEGGGAAGGGGPARPR
mmetsp:Transcript_23506/g.80061  ORF Transcript_23506/g.80061 Transcript_23506/m.80061 type:complete len:204 (+) Transcript_23506:515-1126(+)